MTTKLHQILAVEKGVRSRVARHLADAQRSTSRPDLFNGLAKSYEPLDESGDRYPAERKRVQINSAELLRQTGRLLAELVDISATRDIANCEARADVVLDGETQPLLRDVPVTFLLFLEKQLAELRGFVSRLPVLDAAEEWQFDSNASLYKTAPSETTRTKKIQTPIVLHPPTKEHPAQTQLITEDRIVGHWKTVKHSGALPEPLKRTILERIEKLSDAVKVAREKANAVEATSQKIGRRVFEFLLEI